MNVFVSDAAVVDRFRACRVVPVATIEEPSRSGGAALLAGASFAVTPGSARVQR